MEINGIQFRPIKKDSANLIISLIVFIIAFVTYFSTKAPTVSFWDCGEFIACSYILGIPHPPGSPLFVLIGRVFTLLPLFKEIAVRVNIISVLTSSLTVWLAYLIIVRVVKYWFRKDEMTSTRRIIAYAGGATGALYLTFSSTFWFNAVEAEVYGISMLLMLIITYLAMIWAENRNKPGSNKLLVLIGYLSFLAIGIHMTVFLVIPVVFIFIFLLDREKRLDWRIWLTGAVMFLVTYKVEPFLLAVVTLFFISLAFVLLKQYSDKIWRLVFALMVFTLLGFSVQLYIPIRASLHPAINEDAPTDWQKFKYFLERKQYGEKSMFESMFTRRGSWAHQFGVYPHMGFWGFFRDQYSSEKYNFIPFVLGMLGIWESLRRRWKMGVFLLIIFLLCTVGLVLYMNFSDGTMGERLEVRDRDYFFTPGFMYFAILIGVGLSGFILWVLDLFGNKLKKKSRLAITILLSVLAVAFPLSNTRATHWRSHDRTGNYIPWDYAYNILNSCDKNAILFTNGDNDTFPLWFLQEVEKIRTDVRVVNLSLLNTDWYILQLKHQMGVPIRLTDEQIHQLGPVMTDDNKIIRIQDIMIEEIIKDNNWNEPIYFAVTVPDENRLGLGKNLRMEGMTYRLVPEKGEDMVEPKILEDKIMNVFKFRGLSDSTVYKSESDKRLIANYISAFLQLAEYYKSKGNIDKAVEITLKAKERVTPDWRTYAFLVQLYSELDDTTNIERVIHSAPKSEAERLYLNSGHAYEKVGNVEGAIRAYKKCLRANPTSEYGLKLLLALLYENHKYKDAIEVLDNYIEASNPDPKSLAYLRKLRSELVGVMNNPPSEPDSNK